MHIALKINVKWGGDPFKIERTTAKILINFWKKKKKRRKQTRNKLKKLKYCFCVCVCVKKNAKHAFFSNSHCCTYRSCTCWVRLLQKPWSTKKCRSVIDKEGIQEIILKISS